jgi:uncharacterized SAM-binding protein YcdF (DUF218 family)
MFLFKKIIAQFFSPISLTLELFLLGLFLLYFTSRQKAGKALVLFAVMLLAFCSYTPTADILIKPLIKQYPSYGHDNSLMLNQLPKFVVVLGAGHSDNSSLPVVSRIGYDSLVRLIEGIRIYRLIPNGKLLLSGGSTPGTISSAQDMAQLARELGVIEKDIIIESESRDTKDEAQIISTIAGTERFVLVTSSSHMPRSMALFKKHGMNPIPAPTRSIEERIYYRGPNPFFPSSVNLEKAEMAFHEYLGIIWAKLRRQI